MSLGLIGRKVGMTRLFTDEGEAIPVTVIDVSDNRVAQVKTRQRMATMPFSWLTEHDARVALPRQWLDTLQKQV